MILVRPIKESKGRARKNSRSRLGAEILYFEAIGQTGREWMGNHTPLCGVLMPGPSPSSGEGGGAAVQRSAPLFRKSLKGRYLNEASPGGAGAWHPGCSR